MVHVILQLNDVRSERDVHRASPAILIRDIRDATQIPLHACEKTIELC